MNNTAYLDARLLDYAQQLRTTMPNAVDLLNLLLKQPPFAHLQFQHQYRIAPYIVDFYCPELNLAIELDVEGNASFDAQNHTLQRRAFLNRLGIQVVHYWHRDVLDHTEVVLRGLWHICFGLKDRAERSVQRS